MSGLEEQLGSILGDGEKMRQISELAQELFGGGEGSPPPESGGGPDLAALAQTLLGGGASETGPGTQGSPGITAPETALLGRIGRLLRRDSGDSRQRALLEAMKPYLSEKRRSRMDRAMQLAHMAKLAQLAMGEMGGDEDV